MGWARPVRLQPRVIFGALLFAATYFLNVIYVLYYKRMYTILYTDYVQEINGCKQERFSCNRRRQIVSNEYPKNDDAAATPLSMYSFVASPRRFKPMCSSPPRNWINSSSSPFLSPSPSVASRQKLEKRERESWFTHKSTYLYEYLERERTESSEGTKNRTDSSLYNPSIFTFLFRWKTCSVRDRYKCMCISWIYLSISLSPQIKPYQTRRRRFTRNSVGSRIVDDVVLWNPRLQAQFCWLLSGVFFVVAD